jgi:hypothetical protein
MTTITIQERTRALITSDWSAWTDTTTAPPYNNTDLIEYRSVDENYVQISDLTSNVTTDSNYVVTGDGVFDDLMETLNAHVAAHYKAGRLKASDVASVLVGVAPTMISESLKLLLQRRTNAQELRVLESQEALYKRQKEGFDDNKYQKLFEAQMSSWGLMFSSGLLTEKPGVITSDKASALYDKLIENL